MLLCFLIEAFLFCTFLEIFSMNVHNIMEEVVSQHVNELYEQAKEAHSPWLTCDCENCRLDTISYVLNRVAPKYVVSGRGVTYSSNSLADDHQILADVDALALEGIRLISATKRPFHSLPRKDCELPNHEQPVFNFPTFMGTVLDGSTFEPITGATVLLTNEGIPLEMIDKTWVNPAKTFFSTRGSYSFWVKPLPAESAGIQKKFNFTIEVSAPDYEPVVYSFEVPIESEPSVQSEINSVYSLKIKDLVIFKSDIKNDMEWYIS